MKTQLPVGVIGLGRMGQIYAGHLARRIPQSRLVSVADVIEERARVKAIWPVGKGSFLSR